MRIIFILLIILQFVILTVPTVYSNNTGMTNNDQNNPDDNVTDNETEEEEEVIPDNETVIRLKQLFASVHDNYGCKSPTDHVVFPYNTGLEACIRKYTTASRWPIRCSYAAEITHIECNDEEITSLEGLQQFTNLKSLIISLRGSKIESLAPIRNLTNLEIISIPYSNISEIGFLANLKKLRSLDLKGNQVTNLEFMFTLPNLEILALEYQGPDYITDISHLGSLAKLRTVNLQGNKITDITPLSSMRALSYLNIRDNRVTDLTALADMKLLSYLNFSINAVSDITPLATLPSIAEINGDNNNISDISPLSELIQLKILRLQMNNISDITPLLKLEYLQLLNLDYNYVTDITPISEAIFQLRLKELGLSYNCVPKENYRKIRFFDYIQNVRLDHQCEDFPVDVYPDSQYVVNTDLAGAKNQLEENNIILRNFEATGGSGCSVIPYGSKPIFDIVPFIFVIYLLINRKIRRK